MTQSETDTSTSSEMDKLTAYYAEVSKLVQYFTSQQMESALDLAQELTQDYPDRAEPYLFMGLISYYFHDRGRAVELVTHAHNMAPDIREYADALANMLAQMGKSTDSLYYAKLATTIEPHPHLKNMLPLHFRDYFRSLSLASPSYHYPAAVAMFNLHDIDKCVNHCEMELRVNNDHHEAFDLLGRCYLEMNDPFRARRALHSAIHFAPDNPKYRLHLADALSCMGQFDQAHASIEAAFALSDSEDDELSLRSAVVALLHKFPAHYKAELEKQTDALRSLGADVFTFDTHDTDNPSETISIGYIGSRLGVTRELLFFRPILDHHDSKRFKVHVFFNGANTGSSMRYLETLVESWTPVHDIDDDTLYAIMQGNQLDILIDLDGALAERRGNVIAAQPAPKVLCWPSTRARDDFINESTFSAASGKITDGAPAIITRDPIPEAADVSPLPSAIRQFITFGATADMNAINGPTVALWAKILQTVPNAQMLLTWRGDIPGETATYIADMFGDYGLSSRIMFHRFIASETISEYGEAYFDDIDIMLDTAPSSTPDLLSEALWMGVPIVSLATDSLGLESNGAQILRQAGKSEWIAHSHNEYADKAVTLASDVQALGELRANLREHVALSPLFNPRETLAAYESYLAALIEA